MDSGVLLEWRVSPGDRVKRGEIVAVVDTSKAEIEIEVFEDGVVDELLVPAGERVAVGTPIAKIAAAGQEAPAVAPPPPAAPRAAAGNGRPAEPRPDTRQRVSPVARRMALSLGVDLKRMEGTGPRGAICKADVERAARPAAQTAPAPHGAQRQATMRATIARLMARSKREVPHYYLSERIDLAAPLAELERRNRELPVAERLLPVALLLKATALAAREVPALNGFWEDGGFRAASGVHLGFAVSIRGGGLVAPAIHDTDSKTLDELMRSIRDLVRRTRAGTLRASEMSDPTLTVTNLGERGAEEAYGVIYPPQVALLSFGRITERPWAAGGMLAARPVTAMTLSCDHRASDGAVGSRFLAAVARHLGTPGEL